LLVYKDSEKQAEEIEQKRTMNHRISASASHMALLLLVLSSEPLRCGMPTVYVSAAETPPGVMITQGTTVQGFSYLTGGVSSEEREILEQSGKGYNVRLTFAERGGAYLSDVNLVLTDAKGREIIAIKTNGPFFYIQLPPGSYGVSATFQGETKTLKSLVVPQVKTVQQTFVWNLGEQSPDLKQ
jgi:hypothetical protein